MLQGICQKFHGGVQVKVVTVKEMLLFNYVNTLLIGFYPQSLPL